MGKILFTKTRDVKSPARANQTDAGIDFFVPSFNEGFIKDLFDKNEFLSLRSDDIFEIDDNGKSYFELYPHERALIPSGIKYKMEGENKALIAANKSGVASKLGLIFGSEVGDSSYQGELHISVINTSNDNVKIYEGMKIIQFIETPIIISDIVMLRNEEELFGGEKTKRGDKGFGSSD